MPDKHLVSMGSKSFEDLKIVNESLYHFAGVGKPIEGGKGAVQFVNDQTATCKDFLQV